MTNEGTRIPRETQWPSVLYYLYLHFSALIGLYLAIFQAKWTTIFYSDYILFTIKTYAFHTRFKLLHCFHSDMSRLRFRPRSNCRRSQIMDTRKF